MATRMQQRRGTAAQWAAANPVLADGEVGYEKDTGIVKVGNGSSTWNTLTPILGSQYLPVLGTAYDSDRLDGLDSTAFVKTADPVTAATADTVAKRTSSGALIAATAANAAELTTLAQQTAAISAGRRELISRTVTAAATLALADEGGLVAFNGTGVIACTIPTNAAVPFQIGAWVDIETLKSSSPVQVLGASGVTIRNPVTGFPIVAYDAYSPVRMLKIGTDEWMPIDGTIETGYLATAATSPWPGNVGWRVKNGICFFSYANVSTGATPAGSTIFTFPVGARPPVACTFVSIYAGTAKEINVSTAGILSLNPSQASAGGVAVSGSFPIVVPA